MFSIYFFFFLPKCHQISLNPLFFLIEAGNDSHGMCRCATFFFFFLHLTASDLRLHETTLSRDMSYSGAGRYSQNEFMNKLGFFFFFFPPLHFFNTFSSLVIFPPWKLSKVIVSILIDRERYTDRCFNYVFQWLSCVE